MSVDEELVEIYKITEQAKKLSLRGLLKLVHQLSEYAVSKLAQVHPEDWDDKTQ